MTLGSIPTLDVTHWSTYVALVIVFGIGATIKAIGWVIKRWRFNRTVSVKK